MGPGAGKVIFIVGNSRSGTTMLGRILGAHSDIYTFEELHFFENLVDDAAITKRPVLSKEQARLLVIRLLTSARINIFAEPRVNEYAEEANNIIETALDVDAVTLYRATLMYEALRQGKIIACEQTPRYLFSLPEIFSAFPNARVVNLIRDPRDVMLSQKKKWHTYFHGSWNMPIHEAVRVWANYHPILIGKLWRSCVVQAEKYRNDERFLSVRFEDLVMDSEESVRKICSHVGVSFDESMLDIADIGSSVKKDQPSASGINKNAAARWKQGGLADTELAICSIECGDKMVDYGYSASIVNYVEMRRYFAFPSLVLKAGLSLALNVSRNKNIVSAIKKRFLS